MALVLTSETPLLSNYGEFENDAISGQDQGVLEWEDPYKVGSIWKVDYSGNDVLGVAIDSGTTDIAEEQTVNPTKVVLWLLDKLKDIICEDCDTP
jgi:hypothetical protein|tara:strand:+ start:77 stop:361 length:285 start_codon:yes stop_codon:yes gene_type:complete